VKGVRVSMFGTSSARSCMIFDARNSSRRLTMRSSSENFEMKIESSIAESPPPITRTRWPLKKAPSQTPQVETPRPASAISPGKPGRFGAAPEGRDAAAAAPHPAGPAEPFRLRPHRQDDRLRAVLLVAEEDLLHAAVG